MDLTLMFMPSMPILELVIRGTFTFLALFTLIRVVGRREFMTEGEVMTQLRVHGIEDPRQVHRAYLESNGDISILSHHDDDDARQTISDADRNNGGRKTD